MNLKNMASLNNIAQGTIYPDGVERTAEFAKLPWESLEKLANRLVNEIDGVGKVVYDITHKPSATIEYE